MAGANVLSRTRIPAVDARLTSNLALRNVKTSKNLSKYCCVRSKIRAKTKLVTEVTTVIILEKSQCQSVPKIFN